ncbi:MAG TPA: hypothetical protein VMU68_02505 [Acidimicrobiales bacterium]|nr:hypothetical protein [Acidimicrobiales bacterium]
MRTAVADGIVSTSPCKVEGAGTAHAAERSIASVDEVELLSRAMPDIFESLFQLRRGASFVEEKFSDFEEWTSITNTV